jgi:hypothetical protein
MRAEHLLVALALAGGATGCLSMSTFSTARTLEPGDVRHTAGANFYLVKRDGEVEVGPLPMPMYGISVGVVENFEMSAQVSLPAMARMEGKLNFLREDLFDASLGAAIFATTYPSTNGREEGSLLVGGELPLIMDVNFTRGFSLVPWVAPGYARLPALDAGAPFLRTGLGFHFQGDEYALQPEVSMTYDPGRGEPIDFALGLGLTFGDHPKF